MIEISIIIPARNESASIGRSIGSALGAATEVIVVDGQSSDCTAETARRCGAQVIFSPPGRSIQMNAGAAVAGGAVLLFLHADTTLPPGFEWHVARVLSGRGVVAGAFELHIESPRPMLRLVEHATNMRSRLLQLPYGDQAIFLRRSTFEQIGGFAPLPIMEDFDLVRRLRRLGKIAIASAAVRTSPRRWLARGIARTTLLNQLCIAGYLFDIPPHRLAHWRG